MLKAPVAFALVGLLRVLRSACDARAPHRRGSPWLPATIIAVETAIVQNYVCHGFVTWPQRRRSFVRFNTSHGGHLHRGQRHPDDDAGARVRPAGDCRERDRGGHIERRKLRDQRPMGVHSHGLSDCSSGPRVAERRIACGMGPLRCGCRIAHGVVRRLRAAATARWPHHRHRAAPSTTGAAPYSSRTSRSTGS